VEDAEHPLGAEPHGKDASLEQRQAWRHAERAVGRMRDLAGDRTDRSERDDHREVTGRGGHRGEQPKATRWGDRATRVRPLDRERDHERAM
jgi:hypothetical protein